MVSHEHSLPLIFSGTHEAFLMDVKLRSRNIVYMSPGNYCRHLLLHFPIHVIFSYSFLCGHQEMDSFLIEKTTFIKFDLYPVSGYRRQQIQIQLAFSVTIFSNWKCITQDTQTQIFVHHISSGA